MKFGKIVWLASAAAVSFSSVATAAPKGLNPKLKTPAPISAKEKADGDKAHPQILAEFGGAYQSPQTDYVVKVGKKIAAQTGLGNAESAYTVTLLNSSVNNAFAIPGGYTYITRQLVALCNSEAEMAGVLGHEDGHVAARHSASRQRRSTIAGILGAVGTIGGAILGNSGGLAGILGNAAKQYSGTLAQIFTLKYSRGQEEESDDLGIYYLSKAGYDPTALSDMLNSLAMQTSIDSRAAGQGERDIPEWASTHPDPAKRVVRALANGKTYPASTYRNVDGHMSAINGMLYGDDPKQGVIEGQQFLHPDLRMKFTAPTGFGMQNGSSAVTINGNGGQALLTTAPFNGDRQAYVAAAIKAVVGNQQVPAAGALQQTTVNGIPAFYSITQVTGKSGPINLTIFAYEFGNNQVFHFATIAPASAAPFNGMYQSMARMSTSEAAAVKPRILRVVTVGKNDTISSLSSRMAYSSLQVERFMALNGIKANTALPVGRKVKIVTY
jgi:predicted Zn-dependent protease